MKCVKLHAENRDEYKIAWITLEDAIIDVLDNELLCICLNNLKDDEMTQSLTTVLGFTNNDVLSLNISLKKNDWLKRILASKLSIELKIKKTGIESKITNMVEISVEANKQMTLDTCKKRIEELKSLLPKELKVSTILISPAQISTQEDIGLKTFLTNIGEFKEFKMSEKKGSLFNIYSMILKFENIDIIGQFQISRMHIGTLLGKNMFKYFRTLDDKIVNQFIGLTPESITIQSGDSENDHDITVCFNDLVTIRFNIHDAFHDIKSLTKIYNVGNIETEEGIFIIDKGVVFNER